MYAWIHLKVMSKYRHYELLLIFSHTCVGGPVLVGGTRLGSRLSAYSKCSCPSQVNLSIKHNVELKRKMLMMNWRKVRWRERWWWWIEENDIDDDLKRSTMKRMVVMMNWRERCWWWNEDNHVEDELNILISMMNWREYWWTEENGVARWWNKENYINYELNRMIVMMDWRGWWWWWTKETDSDD